MSLLSAVVEHCTDIISKPLYESGNLKIDVSEENLKSILNFYINCSISLLYICKKVIHTL